MQNESGRSLIEIIGVLAIAGVMSAGAIGIYNSIRHTQARTIASAKIEEVARDVKILMGHRGTYDGVSVGYLVKAGAISTDASPIGGQWSVTPTIDGAGFSINLTDLSEGDCDYFAAATPTWATRVVVNGYDYDTNPDSHCFSSSTNELSFIVE